MSETIASDAYQWTKHRVAVNVQCEDESVRSQISSFIRRELRDLGDVVVTHHAADFALAVVAIRWDSRETDIYAASVLLTESAMPPSRFLRPTDFPEDQIKLLDEMYGGIPQALDHNLVVGGIPSIKAAFTEQIAEFDAAFLEPVRRYRRQLDELSD
ncbi:hypothetical protein [Algiphilus aromaticivorans]|uniref:hypothetical protein n=1 Tax=Algiphilus aromaticivorans TaxID=382454 RepID=UPI0005C15DBD|nr:hypothetical protein [Algiphilus aromaticivorans]